MVPEIQISKQNSLFQEVVVKNGVKKNVNYIVKNTPFMIDYKLVNMPINVNFKNSRVSCSLLYDLKSKKEVDFITKKPLEYVVHPSDDGMSCSIEFRVKVLTTQLEGSFFLIHTVLEHQGLRLAVESESIKAVSKPAQIRRKIAQRDGIKAAAAVKRKTGKKRSRNGSEMSEYLDDIQRVQQEHTQLLQSLVDIMGKKQAIPYYYPGYYADPNSIAYAAVEARPATYVTTTKTQPVTVKPEPVDPEQEFEDKFKELIELYSKLNPDNRKNKMRKVMDSMEQTYPLPVEEIRSAVGNLSESGTDEIFAPNLQMDELTDFCLEYLQGNV